MKKRRIYKSIVVFFLVASFIFSVLPATIYATESGNTDISDEVDESTDDSVEDSDDDWLYGSLQSEEMGTTLVDTSDGISALGGRTNYDVANSKNYAKKNGIKSTVAKKQTGDKLKITGTITFPELGHGFYYAANTSISINLCKGIYPSEKKNGYMTGMGWSTCSKTTNQFGLEDPSANPNYGALGVMKTHITSGSGLMDGAKKTNDYYFQHPGGSTYRWTSRTTQTKTGYKNRNFYPLSTKKITIASGKTVPNDISYSVTMENTDYKKIIAWLKAFGVSETTKNGVSGYVCTIAASYDPAVGGNYYAISGCSEHGQFPYNFWSGNSNGTIYYRTDNSSSCTAASQGHSGGKTSLGSSFSNNTWAWRDSGNGTEYVNSPNECRVISYGEIFIPSITTPIEIDLEDIAVDKGGTLASYTENFQLNTTDYATKEVTSGTTVNTTSTWGAPASYTGYTYLGEVPSDKKVTKDTTFKRLYAPTILSVTCQDEFYKGSTLVKTSATPGGAKNYSYADSAKGSDWGTASPDTNYEYSDCTQVVVNQAGLVVKRIFKIGTGKIIYHSNIPNNDTTLPAVEVYPGDKHTTKASNAFARTQTVDGETLNWVLTGWRTDGGDGKAVEYNCGTAYDFSIAKGGEKHLYAVWEPVLKVVMDAGFRNLTINNMSFAKTEETKQLAYNTAVKAASMAMNAGYLFDSATVDGTSIADLKKKIQDGTAVTAMTSCHVLRLHSVDHAANPEKYVYKSGTTTDVNECIVNVGDTLDYVIKVHNTTSVSRDVDVTDKLDAGVTFVPASADNGGTYDAGTGIITWHITGVPSNGEKILKFTVTVNEAKKGSTISNKAVAVEKGIAALGESDGEPEDTPEVKNYVLDTPVKHMRKTADAADVIDDTIIIPGQTAVYTIDVTNPSPNTDKSKFDIKDSVPKGFTIKSVSDGGSIAGQTVTWSGISIAKGATKTLTIEVEANDLQAGDTIINKADVTCTDAMNSKVSTNEVVNYMMKAPEKSVYLTLNSDGTPNTDTENIDEQIINDGILLTYRINWQNPTAGERTIILKDTVPEGTRIATAADLDKASEGMDLSEDLNIANGGSFLISDNGTYDEATNTVKWELTSSVAAADGTKDNNFVEFSVVVLNYAQDKYVENYASMTVQSPTGINENNPTMDSNLVRNPVLKTPHKIAKRGDQDVTDLVVNDEEEITYHITFKNPADKEKNFTVTDIVPEFTELIDGTISDGGTYSAEENLITWKMPLAAGEEKTVSFTVKVLEEGQNKTVKNTARVYADKADAKTDDDVPTKIYILEDPKKAVMNVDGEDINGIVKRSGDIITYQIVYKNPADDERVATITDKLPDGVMFVAAANQGSYDVENAQFVDTEGKCTYKYDADTNTIVWTTPTAAKCQEMVSVDVRILDSAKGTILRNTASVYIPDATKQTNEVVNPVVKNPVKTAADDKEQDLNGNLVTVGQEFTYAVTIENPAEESKEGYITDVLPSQVDFVSCTEGGIYDEKTHSVMWKKMALKSLEKRTVKIRVKVNETAKNTTIENNAVFRIDEASVSTDLRDGGDGGPKSYVSVKEVLDKKGNDINTHIVASGSTILYKISYKNVTDKEKYFTIVDEIPQGEEVVEIGDGGFICKRPLDGFSSEDLTDNTVGWQFYVPAGQEGFVTVTTKVTATKECKLKNHATIRIVESENAKDAFVMDTNEVVNPVIPYPVKMVFNEAGREITDKMVTTGDVLTYKITYKNPADEDKLATIIDILPEEVEFVSSDDGGVYDSGSHTVKWTDVESKAHEMTTVSFVVKVKETAGGKTISNRGTVSIDQAVINTRAKTASSDPEDPEPSDDPTVDNYVSCKKSLDVNGNDISDEVVKVGDTLVYSILYANTSSAEKEYRIKDVLPDEVDYVSATGDPAVDGKTLTWKVTAKGGQTGHLDVTVKINEKGYGKKITNKADITEFDPQDPDNPYTITTTAVNNYPLDKDDFVKSVEDKSGNDMDGGVAVTGSKLFYHIRLHNPAESRKKFTVTDALPEEVKYVSSSEGGVYDSESHTVKWEIELEGDAEADLEICVKIKNTLTSGEIKNLAHLVTKGTEADSNEVITYVFSAPEKKQFAGTVELGNGDEVECSDEVKYTITFENPSDKEMEVMVTDVIDKSIADRILDISKGGTLKDGKIIWNLDVKGGAKTEVSFTVSAPEQAGVTVKNTATITYDDDSLNGKNTYKTNEVNFVTKAKGGEDTPGNDPRKTPEIVKTGDGILGIFTR